MNKRFTLILILMSLLALYVNFQHYIGFVEQYKILSDKNSILKYDDVFEIKEYLPNITATTIPIYESKILYFLSSKKTINIDSLKAKIFNYSSPNPYLGLKDRIIAELYLREGNNDSARYFFRKAFLKLPNNQIYNTNYFNLLADIYDSISLKKAFSKVKRPAKISLKNYINNTIRVIGYNKQYTTNLIDSLKKVYPEDKNFAELSIINKIGHSFYKKSQLEESLAEKDFNKMNFKNAVKGYLNTIQLNPYNPKAYENLAISYMKINDFDKARSNFKIVIDSFELKTGKSEFYYGVLNLEIDKKEACNYLKIANKLEFSGAVAFINKYCNN